MTDIEKQCAETDKLLADVMSRFNSETHQFGMAYKDPSDHGKLYDPVYYPYGDIPALISEEYMACVCVSSSGETEDGVLVLSLVRSPEHDLIPRKEVDALTKRNAELEAALKDARNILLSDGLPEYANDKALLIIGEAIANNAGKDKG